MSVSVRFNNRNRVCRLPGYCYEFVRWDLYKVFTATTVTLVCHTNPPPLSLDYPDLG